MEGTIVYKDLEPLNIQNARYLITIINVLVFDWVAEHLNPKEGHWTFDDYTNIYTYVKEAIKNCYPAEDEDKILTSFDEDSNAILKDMAKVNDDTFIRSVVYEIGTNSDSELHFSAMERIILITAAAKREGIKFDFNRNL